MIKEEASEMKNSIYVSTNNPSETSLYSDFVKGSGDGYVNHCSMFDSYMGNNGFEGELGFLEMLGVQEFQIPMGYTYEEMLEREMFLPSRTEIHHQVTATGDVNSNPPGTPNSSSISSASNNEVVVESEHENAEDGDVDDEDGKDQEGSGKSKKL